MKRDINYRAAKVLALWPAKERSARPAQTGRSHRNPESGYALLLIFAMAAIVAVTLYSEVPRVAFEAQRDKEQLLIDRGQEYSRAITLFVRKFNRFPTSMDELENTNNVRFLRRRYADPMTGKADWRILHAGPGGVITDSIMSVKKADATTHQTFITELPMFGATPAGSGEGVNPGTRLRPSDQAGAAGNVNSGNGTPANSGSSSGNSSSGISGYNGPVMVLPDGRIVPANASGTAPQPVAPGGNPAFPGFPGTPGGAAPFVPNGAQLPNGVAIQQNGQGAPPGLAAPPNSAAGLINKILTSPRPGGMNGLPGGPGVNAQGNPLTAAGTGTATIGTQAPQQQVIGAGLAGVASKREQEGIKTVNDRTKYNEWEFVYDVTKDPAKMGQQGAGAPGGTGGPGRGGPPGAPGQPGPTPVGPGMTPGR